MHKKCFKCGQEKPLTEFYNHPQMGDGTLGKCKECARRDVRENRALRREQYQDYEQSRKRDPRRIEARKAYAQTDAGRESMRRARMKWADDKRAAHVTFGNAVRDGRIKEKPCCVCGTTVGVDGHHEDYSRPLDVIWLCRRHHAEYHVVRRRAKKLFGRVA